MPRAVSEKLHNVYYGWWIVGASMASLTVASLFYWQGFSLFFLPLQEEFSTNRTALSAVISISQLEGGILGPLGGYLVDRFGPRKMTALGAAMMGVGFIAMSQVNSFMAFYIVFLGLISLGMGIGIRVTAITAPANWFIRKRGIAVGLTLTGGGLGGFFLPILALLIVNMGWRPTSVIAGLTILAVGLPAAMVMRRRPEEYGLLPDGDKPDPVMAGVIEKTSTSPGNPGAVANQTRDFTLRQAMALPLFWLLAVVFGMRQFAISAIQLHQVPNLVDKGFNFELASTILAAVVVLSIVGRLGFGWLADKYRPHYVMAVSVFMVAASALLMAYVSQWWHLVLFAVLYAVGWGGGAVVMNAVRGAYFGRRAFGTITGMMDFVQMFGLVLGPVFAGLVFDTTQSYYIAFITFAVVTAIAGILMLFLRAPRPSQQAT